MDKTKKIILTCFRAVLTAVLIASAAYLCIHFKEYQRNATNQVNKYRIDQVCQLTEDTVVKQYFVARHTHLKTVKVYFGNDYAGQAKGNVILDIVNQKTKKIESRIKLEISSLANNDYTEFNTDLQLQKGDLYAIVLSSEHTSPGKEPLIFQWKKKSSGFKKHMIVNYTIQKKYLVARFYYPVIIYRQWAGICLSILILILLLWFPLPLPTIIQRFLSVFMPLVAPLFIFWIVERFTDNSLRGIASAELVFNILVYYMFFGVLYILLYYRKLSTTVGMAFFYIAALANYYVLQFKGSPIVPSDFKSAGTAAGVAGNYTYTIQPVFIWNALFVLLFIGVLLRTKATREMKWKSRIAMGCIIFVMSAVLGHFIVEQKTLKSYGIKNNVWDQKKGYAKNGFFFGFVLNMNSLVNQKPEDYSVDAAKSIASKYEELYANKKESKKRGILEPKSGKKPNVIAIMNEAFSDLSVINDFSTNEDYMPYVHSLKKNTVKGNLYMSIFGSGTCNSEFEFLTGNSMAFLQSGIIAYTQIVKDKLPNMTWLMQSQGYQGNIALHPYLASGWNRPEVYEYMGFSHYYSEDDFTNPLMYRKYISDQSDFEKLEELYENRENKDDPFYLFTVTMQNHGGFDKMYPNFPHEIQITDSHKNVQAEQYLSLVKKSDEAFQKLTRYFSKVDEPTLIIMFGDHQPSVDPSFFDGLFGKPVGDLTNEELLKKYQVPFIVWANYDIKEKTIDKMSANYLGAWVMKEAGLSISPYQEFLLDVRKELPVLNAMGCIDKDGKYYEIALDTPYKELVSEYQIMQYNNLIDTKNTVNSFFYLKDQKKNSSRSKRGK